MRKTLGNLLLCCFTLAVMALIGEGVVRAFFKDDTALFPRYHTDYQYGRYALRGIRPGAEFWHTSADGSWRFVTNSRGFRNERDFAYEKPSGVLRVLALGDSHTQGYEVKQDATFSAVLERYLARRGISAEVLNAGVSGYSNAEALAFLENEGHKYSPDVVVLGFYANDFADNLKAGLFALDEKGALVEQKLRHLPGVQLQNLIYSIPGVQWLGENSYFYNLLFNNVWVFFKDRLKQGAFEYADAKGVNFEEREIDLALALLRRMQRFCAERGIRLIVVDIPERPGPHRFASSVPQKMREAFALGGIDFIDSRQILEDLDGAAEFHLPNGHQHISALTHALIGAQVGRRIVGRDGEKKNLLVRHQ